MAILQVRDIDDRLYEHLKRVSQEHRRSLSQEVLHILETHLSDPSASRTNSTEAFLQLAGSWEDDRTPEEIVTDLKRDRQNSGRFAESDGLFD